MLERALSSQKVKAGSFGHTDEFRASLLLDACGLYILTQLLMGVSVNFNANSEESESGLLIRASIFCLYTIWFP